LALDEETATWLGGSVQAPPAEPETVEADTRWRTVLAYFDRDESELESLVHTLIRRRLPAPIVGYELGEHMWPAELAWPEQRIAVVVSGPRHDPEILDRDSAYAAAGWQARTARDWSIEELVAHIDVVDTTAGGSR
jgi:hypothetical protein